MLCWPKPPAVRGNVTPAGASRVRMLKPGGHSMSRLSNLDPGVPGTARWRRIVELEGITQEALGLRMHPPVEHQATISLFEVGAVLFSWAKAQQYAPGYFAELFARDRQEAKRAMWRLWFANVEAFGKPAMKALAARLKEKMGPLVYGKDAVSA